MAGSQLGLLSTVQGLAWARKHRTVASWIVKDWQKSSGYRVRDGPMDKVLATKPNVMSSIPGTHMRDGKD